MLVLIMTLAASAHPAASMPALQGPGEQVYLPVIRSGAGDVVIPPPPEDEASSRISVPPGFEIRIFATDLGRPRLMTVGPDGMLYVALYNANVIVRLPDRNHDGLADDIELAASGLISPHNLEFRNGVMYVAEIGRVSRLSDNNGDGVYETRQTVTDNIPGSGGHNTRTLHFGPDGNLYVAAGSSSNVTIESDPRRAAILRFTPEGGIPADNPFAGDPDTRKQAVWAYGLRNSVDFLWRPNGTLWATHNGSDGMGDDVPPEELVIAVQKGQNHGWPYCYTPTMGVNIPQQPEVRDTRVPLPAGFNCGMAVPALLTIPAHSAPLGITAAAGSDFPAAYQDDAFAAIHGSWNTTSGSVRDCKVERIIVENGQVTGSETFATGWRAPGQACGAAATWGRPAGVTIGSDGALYISDDKGGRIYRVFYTGN